MANQKETNSYNNQMETFTEALATARQMQQDWLSYGLNFIHLYVDDVDGDWLETWEHDEIFANPVLDHIKEFLVSDDIVAFKLRDYLGDRSLFDLAVNLEEMWRITPSTDRLATLKNILAIGETDDGEISDLADSLLTKLTEML
ncbi:hypothetical protein [Nostoc sp. UHCC 0870]|uniref:hypothetical protein n=1 Tax=Nostoc sp. UHCC 0870 TaxID=2914041 RepID=UPI001EDE393D|nr:hypothetical protein [Nostoc sp. UHCC 0870]UKO97536.1 hypothetical protein L6494_23660 [Nostoc sp. UHCC 0870]